MTPDDKSPLAVVDATEGFSLLVSAKRPSPGVGLPFRMP
jgi:hypothetical protein